MTRTLEERFWQKVTKSDGCWLWAGSRHRQGYGQFAVERTKIVVAHRVAWTLVHGPIPAGKQILHSCDTPACVRPDHLHLGSQRDNMREMVLRERSGQRRGYRKLSTTDIRRMRKLRAK